MMKDDHAIRGRVVCSLSSLIEREVLITKTLAKPIDYFWLIEWVSIAAEPILWSIPPKYALYFIR